MSSTSALMAGEAVEDARLLAGALRGEVRVG